MLAFAYIQRAMSHEEKEGDYIRDKDICLTLKYLKITVDESNRIGKKVDWQLIMNSDYLKPLHSHEKYQELIRGR